MRRRLEELESAETGYATPQVNIPHMRGLPIFHNNTWSPWLKPGEAAGGDDEQTLTILNMLDLD